MTGAAPPSDWARTRFGAAAAVELGRVVPLAIGRAHELALAAHVASTLDTNDAYGSTLAVTQHRQLADLARDVPTVALRKPVGLFSRFELIVLDSTAVVLYPWRYAADRSRRREECKLRAPVSDLRKNLLTLTARIVDPQLTLDQADLDLDRLAAEFAEEQAAIEQLAEFGQVVTVAYASSPSLGVFDLGWGDAELVDEQTGELVWHHWESLPRSDQAGSATTAGPLAPVTPSDGVGGPRRFDDGPLDDDFGLIQQPEQPRHTGSDEPR